MWDNLAKKLASGSTYFDCEDADIKKAIPACRKNNKNNLTEKFIDSIYEKPDIIEEFNPFKAIGGIFSALKNIGKFFSSIVKMAGDLVKTFFNLVKITMGLVTLMSKFDKFLSALASFFFWIIGTILLLVLKVKIGLPLGHRLTSLFYRILYLLPVAVFNSSIFLILLLVRLILTIIIVIMDNLTYHRASKWFYKFFLACEVSPFAWYENTFFHKGNQNQRDLVCKKNCHPGYKLSNDGSKCEKIPNYIPNYCPTSQLMRIYRGLEVPGALNMKSYTLPMGMTESQKEKYIEDFKKNKKDYYESCQNININKYDNVAKNICSTMEFTNNSKTSDKDMQNICYNKYCRNGSHESFCTKLNSYNNNSNINSVSNNDIIKTICIYSLVVSTLVVAIYAIDKKLDILKTVKNDLTAIIKAKQS